MAAWLANPLNGSQTQSEPGAGASLLSFTWPETQKKKQTEKKTNKK